jgi:hypothetical protein
MPTSDQMTLAISGQMNFFIFRNFSTLQSVLQLIEALVQPSESAIDLPEPDLKRNKN